MAPGLVTFAIAVCLAYLLSGSGVGCTKISPFIKTSLTPINFRQFYVGDNKQFISI